MTISKTQPSYRTICVHCFKNLTAPLHKARAEFIIEILCLFLSISRVNFVQLARFVGCCEQRFRIQFAKSFDWLAFNTSMIEKSCALQRAIAFDPCYIPKSGKSTQGISRFWSGCAGAVKRGLEICGIAALDLDNNTAMHLLAVQTILKEGENLLQFYARILVERASDLKKISNIIVADAYFSKYSFVKTLLDHGFNFVGRLRDDAVLYHILNQDKTGKRGRPKTKGERVDFDDLSQFDLIKGDDTERIYTSIVKSKSLKMNIRIVYVIYVKTGASKIYFSTHTTMLASQILNIYRNRFQIEFLYRDAKQHTSLTKCEARSKEKLDFHFNASLTAINLAKQVHWYSLPLSKRKEFSMSTIKTINHNKLLIDRFMSVFGLDPNILKNKQHIKELMLYGTKAA